MKICSRWITLLGGSALCFAGVADAAPGIWQKHDYAFQFLGFTTTYSCDGLADKLKMLLIAAGARADVKSYPGACASEYGRPDPFANAHLTFYTLTPPAADAAPGSTVDGTWRPVLLAARSPLELATGDCELVEQFKDKVLPLFTTREVDSKTTCIPHQDSGSVISLKFDSFVAPLHKAGAQPVGAAGSGT